MRWRIVRLWYLGCVVCGVIAAGCTQPAKVVAADRATPPTTIASATALPTTPAPFSLIPIEPTAAVPPTPTLPPTPTAVVIPPSPTPVPLQSRTLLFSGDVLSHTPVIASALAYGADTDLAYDYRPMFADVQARVTNADLAICVLETPVSNDNIGLDGYPTFEAPRELPDALVSAGYDGCSTASNHSMDRGASGVRTTLDEMDRVSLGHAGMARTQAEANAPRIYDLDGVSIAHLSYSYSLNGFRLPEDEPWLVNLNSVEDIVAEGERARAAGADIVVLSIQWGIEYQQEPSAEQEMLADKITGSGAVDLIMGNHVHVVQPVTSVNGVPVVYGLGNSLSNQSDNCCRTGTQDGVMVEATVSGNHEVGYRVTALAFAPTWVDRTTFTIIDLIAALNDPALDENLRAVYQTSFDRTSEAIHSLQYEIPLAD